MSGILSFFTLFLAGFVNTAKGIIFSFLLSIDSVAYRLVAYSFKVFNILCTLNFNSLYGIVSPLIDRIQVVMIVFIVFQLGMALLKYLLNPDELQKDGTKLVKNIFIATALFVSYNFVFSVMNELSIALMGNSIGYRYTTIGEIFDLNDEDGNGKNDPGLIMRFIFGSEGVNNGEDKVGESIAVSLAGVFIKDVINGEETDESGYLYREILDENSGSVDFSRMERLGDYVANGNVKYTMIIGFVVCLFVVYSVFSASIQVGVRMFKLVILQMICPLVIVDVIKNGIGGKLKKFGEVYISVFIEAFVRMLTILIITVFVSKFLIRIDAFFPQLSSGEGIITKGIIMVIIVIAAYTFAGQIPKFIDDVLGTKMSSGKTGNFVGSVLGAGLGAIGGFVGGAVAGGGVAGAMGGLTSGAFRGFGAGSKGNTVADLFKSVPDNVGKGIESGARRRELLANKKAGKTSRFQNMFGAGAGYAIGKSTGLTAAHNARIDAEKANLERKWKDNFKKNNGGKSYEDYMEDMRNRNQELSYIDSSVEEELKSETFDFGGNTFAWKANDEDVIATDSAYQKASAALDGLEARRKAMLEKNPRINTSGIDSQIATAQADKAKAHQAAKMALDKARDDKRDATTAAKGTTVSGRRKERNENERSMSDAQNKKYNDLDKELSTLDKQKIS